MFIFVPLNHGAQAFREVEVHPCQHATVYRELAVAVAVVLLATALIIVVALLAGAAAGKLARMDGATYPAALARAATAFATVITLATAVATAIAALLV